MVPAEACCASSAVKIPRETFGRGAILTSGLSRLSLTDSREDHLIQPIVCRTAGRFLHEADKPSQNMTTPMKRFEKLSTPLLAFILCFCLTVPIHIANAEDVPQAPMPDLEKLTFRETPSGLKYAVLERGDDLFTPGTGQTPVVHYTGWFMDGRKFDSSRDHGAPLRFKLGEGRVIRGWEEGLARMGKGSRWIFIIPPDLGYGKRGKSGGRNPIPGNATLVFEIELLDIE